MTAWVADIFAAALIIWGVRNGAKKGLIRSVWRIAEWALTIALVFVLSKPLTGMLAQTSLYDDIYSMARTAIAEKLDEAENKAITGGDEFYERVSDAFGIPKAIVPYALPDLNSDSIAESARNAADNEADRVSGTAAMLLIRIIAGFSLLVIIRLLLWAVFALLNTVSKVPVLKQANSLLGGILGFVNIMLTVYLICAAMCLISPTGESVYKVINETILVKYLYNNNILLKLFIKI